MSERKKLGIGFAPWRVVKSCQEIVWGSVLGKSPTEGVFGWDSIYFFDLENASFRTQVSVDKHNETVYNAACKRFQLKTANILYDEV